MPDRTRSKTIPAPAKRVAFDQVAAFSPWPAILTGARPFAARQRTAGEVLREYGTEKWGRVLDLLRSGRVPDHAQLLRWQGIDPAQPMLYSEAGDFLRAPADQVFARYREMLLGVLKRHRRPQLVELGSGLGDKLLDFARALGATAALGGEFTASGLACGRTLSRQWRVPARFFPFDFNNPRGLDLVPAGALVYTAHAIEQVPRLRPEFIQALCRRRPRWVVHFEPCYEDRCGQSVPGLMRRRYAEINDYNRNLVGLLRTFEARGSLRIVEHRRDVFGHSPFNSTSVLVWTPVGA